MKVVVAAFNQEKALVRGLLHDYTTSNFAKVRLKLYWTATLCDSHPAISSTHVANVHSNGRPR